MHKTVEGGTVDVTGSGDSLKVDNANVVCGGVKTANATVYLIDSVLSPHQLTTDARSPRRPQRRGGRRHGPATRSGGCGSSRARSAGAPGSSAGASGGRG